MSGYKNENRGKKAKGNNNQWLYSSEFCFIGGSVGFIYKNSVGFHEPWRYKNKNEIVYIPQYGFPDDKNIRVPEDKLLSYFSRQDLINLTQSESLAAELFAELSWQQPENLWNEWCADSDQNGHWIECCWAYEKVYLPEFAKGVDHTGQSPVCLSEFTDVEWKDKEYRKYCLNRLAELDVITKADVTKIIGAEME